MADDKILAFDTLYTNNQIQLYKIMLPYLRPKMQHTIAILIKYMELRYTISFCNSSLWSPQKEKAFDINKIWDDFLPYCSPSQRDSFSRLKNMMQTMESAKEMMSTMEMMQQMFPEGFAFNPSDTDSMQDIFQMFQTMNPSS